MKLCLNHKIEIWRRGYGSADAIAVAVPTAHERKDCSICNGTAAANQARSPVVALGYKAPDGTITVTDVLCTNFPEMTNEEKASLSWKLDEWSRAHQ